MKSKKLAKLFVALGLIVPTLAGCSSNPFGNAAKSSDAENNVSENQQNSQPESESNPTSQPGGQGQSEDGIQAYQGDTSKTVGKISNTPVTEYSQTTKDAIMRFAKTISSYSYQEIYDSFSFYMLKMKVGNELAIEFCNTFIEFYALGTQSFSAYNPEPLGPKAEKMSALCYKFLTILNSIDASAVASVLEEVNKEVKTARQKEFDERKSFEEVGSVYLNGFSSSDYEVLKRVKEATKTDNKYITDILTTFEYAKAHYNYSEYERAGYEAETARMQERINEPVIPTMVIDFLKKHAGEARDLLVKDLKLIVDAYCSMIPDMLSSVKESNTNRSDELYYSYNYQHYYQNDSRNNVSVSRASYETLLENRTLYLGLLKSIVADPALGDLVLDAMIEMMLPAYRQYAEPEAEDLAKVTQLETRLKALSGQQVSSLVNFAIKALALIEDEDIVSLIDILEATTYTGEFDEDFSESLFALGDKYAAKLGELIAGLTANEKNDILSVGQIFKIDILKEIQDFLVIYNAKDLSTEEGAQAFLDAVQNWAMKIYETLDENFFFMFHGSDSGQSQGSKEEPKSQEEYPLELSFGNLYLGKTYDAEEDVYFHINEKGYEYYISGNYKSWNQTVQEAKEFLQRYEKMSDEEKEWYSYEYERSLAFADLEISNFSFVIDTTKCGETVYTFTYTFKGKTYSGNGYATVGVEGLDSMNALYVRNLYENPAVIYTAYHNHFDVPIILKNGEIKYSVWEKVQNGENEWDYDYQEKEYAIDTSKEGWNFLMVESDDNYSRPQFFFYYVVDQATLKNNIADTSIETGYILQGEDSFAKQPYACTSYSFEDGYFSFSKSYYLDNIPQSELQGKPINTYLQYTDERGVEFEYFIVSPSSKLYSTIDFSIYGYYSYYEDSVDVLAHNWSAEEIAKYNGTEEPLNFRIYEYTYYYVEVSGIPQSLYIGSEPKDKATNFNYQNGVFTFTFRGTQYSFVIKGVNENQ